MTKDQALQNIEVEVAKARQARLAGNEGMVRVCARRASGVAISHWIETEEREGWGSDALGQLRNITMLEEFPAEVRTAAERLTTRVNKDFDVPFEQDPLEDANMIIEHFLR